MCTFLCLKREIKSKKQQKQVSGLYLSIYMSIESIYIIYFVMSVEGVVIKLKIVN